MFLDEPDDLFTPIDLDVPSFFDLEVRVSIEDDFSDEFAGIIGGDVFTFPFYDL